MNMENEIWKDIVGFEGKYQISNLGNVRSLNYRNSGYARNLTPKTNCKGYNWVILYNGKIKKPVLIHRLVAKAFIDNPNGYPIINHKDEIKTNNVADNLEWCTLSYNVIYSMERHPERYMLLKGERKKRNFYKIKSKYASVHINQLDLNGAFIKQWFNLAELKHVMNYNNTSIKECCIGKRKTAYGYKWEFADKNASSLFI